MYLLNNLNWDNTIGLMLMLGLLSLWSPSATFACTDADELASPSIELQVQKINDLLSKEEKTLEEESELQTHCSLILKEKNKQEHKLIHRIKKQISEKKLARLGEIFELDQEYREATRRYYERPLWSRFLDVCNIFSSCKVHPPDSRDLFNLQSALEDSKKKNRMLSGKDSTLEMKETLKHLGHIEQNDSYYFGIITQSQNRASSRIGHVAHSQRLYEIEMLHNLSPKAGQFYDSLFKKFFVTLTVYQELNTGKLASTQTRVETVIGAVGSTVSAIPGGASVAFAAVQAASSLIDSVRSVRSANAYATFTPESLKDTAETLALQLSKLYQSKIEKLYDSAIDKKAEELGQILYRIVCDGEVLNHFDEKHLQLRSDEIAKYLVARAVAIYGQKFPKLPEPVRRALRLETLEYIRKTTFALDPDWMNIFGGEKNE